MSALDDKNWVHIRLTLRFYKENKKKRYYLIFN